MHVVLATTTKMFSEKVEAVFFFENDKNFSGLSTDEKHTFLRALLVASQEKPPYEVAELANSLLMKLYATSRQTIFQVEGDGVSLNYGSI